MSKLREQFEKETGNISINICESMYITEIYVKWLEQRLESRQHETVAIGLPTDDEVLNA